MPGRQFKADSRNSTLLTPAFQRVGHLPTATRPAPSTSNTCMCAHSQPRWHMGTPGIHFALRRNSTPPPAFIFLENPPPIKGSRGQEVSPEIDVSCHCQLCAMATSFFQSSGETWRSKTAIPKGWDHFRPIPQSHHCPGVPGKMLSVSIRRQRETPRSFASPEQLVIYLTITASVAAVSKIQVVKKTGRAQSALFSPQLLSQTHFFPRDHPS